MKKLIVCVCALVLVLCLASAAAAEPMSILILTSSGVNDGNFNQDCYEGILSFLEKHGDCTVTDVKEEDLAQLIPALDMLVGDYDVFVLPGYNFGRIGDIALNNPDKYFLVVDSDLQDSEGNPMTADNVYTMTYKEQEGGFMAGVAAALSTKSGKVAEVNGIAYPSNVNYQFGFMSGVNYVNAKYGKQVECVELPSCAGVDMSGTNVGGNYVGDFAKPDKGKEIAGLLISEGCDVLFAAAGASGNGVLLAAKEAEGVWFIGCDVDQYNDGASGSRNVVLTSALKVMHLDVERQLEAIYNGTFAGENALLGADTDSVGYVSAEGRQQLDNEALAAMAETFELLKSGAIVPASSAEYAPTDFPGLK